MKINSIKRVTKKGSRLRGIASVILENNDIIYDIRIIEGTHGLFIAFPSLQSKTENTESDFDGIMLRKMEQLIINEFNKIIN